ncbi:TIGR03571 family LLM class oxidoreductase [Halostagnicola sp. A-GB9-2]|uniref:TIGR03571 family LLM class oxidoreductase n=1 Tax=Halostagnicola sp. A-GB9-2 TaxID=3048066 RepID=UPI0024C00721|nr:TIGR03571 family LLM class oxidoreductase [Halostagnicola sp. A-GB9-2]MDJ1432310.1 TIGR03571 family LLM class oxidoreductase [Halostagnicola sp. A-GB9-2]
MPGYENAGYRRLFEDEGLSFGLSFPLTDSSRSRPNVAEEMRLARRAESLGFDALWCRDVPTYWPKFGDAGQTFDPWTWLSHIAAHTDEIALGTASIVLSLRHPLHVAKAAASIDRLSDGRLVLGVATGDRDPEFPAFDVDPSSRGALFRDAVKILRTVWSEPAPELESRWGTLSGELELVPKPTTETLPLLPTGHARQDLEWIAENGDGWLFYHLPESTLESFLTDWREQAGEKPFSMAMGVEFAGESGAEPTPIHQGMCAEPEWFREYFRDLERMGVDHVIVGLGGEDRERALETFEAEILTELS